MRRISILTSTLIACAATSIAQCTTAWAPLGGLNQGVRTLLVAKNGDLIAGGDFTQAGGQPANKVARFDGTQWRAMGNGLPWAVHALAELSDGSIVGGGMFGGIWRWNGTSWSMLGSSVPYTWDICALPGGGCAIAGSFPMPGGYHAATWDGSTWQGIGGGLNGDGLALARTQSGDLIYGGAFTNAGGVPCNFVAKWNGAQWSPLGVGLNDLVIAVCAMRDCSIVVGGNFTQAGGQAAQHIARWDGSQWHPLGAGVNGSVLCITEMPEGDLLVGGDFTQAGSTPASRIARWDGAQWSALGAGTSQIVWDVAAPTREHAFVGGVFTTAGGIATDNIARIGSSCAPTAIAAGAGCDGLSLSAERYPWLGGELTTRCTGLPTGSVAFSILGFAPASIPLATLLPQALPACVVHTTADLIGFSFALDGTSRTRIEVPRDPFLLGANCWRQDVGITFGPTGDLATASATDAIRFSLGSF